MSQSQPGILDDVPAHSRYLTFSIKEKSQIKASLALLGEFADGDSIIVGIGKPVATALKARIPGLKAFPTIKKAQVTIPATQAALWVWLRGADRGELVHAGRKVIELLDDAFSCDAIVDGFRFDIGRDLTGYEDGTENPEGDEATSAAIATDGSSYVAVQQWVHDLDDFLSRPEDEQDETIGRRKSDNEEMDDAPVTAHVKRTAQEDYDPEAFMVRRSMPWSDGGNEGLVFVAFGKSFDAYTAVLTRMSGAEDDVVDALFSFSTPVNGSFYWCPPMQGETIDLSALLDS